MIEINTDELIEKRLADVMRELETEQASRKQKTKKPVTVHSKHGTYQSTRWVSTGEDETPAKKADVGEVWSDTKIKQSFDEYGKTSKTELERIPLKIDGEIKYNPKPTSFSSVRYDTVVPLSDGWTLSTNHSTVESGRRKTTKTTLEKITSHTIYSASLEKGNVHASYSVKVKSDKQKSGVKKIGKYLKSTLGLDVDPDSLNSLKVTGQSD